MHSLCPQCKGMQSSDSNSRITDRTEITSRWCAHSPGLSLNKENLTTREWKQLLVVSWGFAESRIESESEIEEKMKKNLSRTRTRTKLSSQAWGRRGESSIVLKTILTTIDKDRKLDLKQETMETKTEIWNIHSITVPDLRSTSQQTLLFHLIISN